MVQVKNQKLNILTSEYVEGASLCDELNIAKTTEAFKRFARSQSIEIMKDKDDPIAQLEVSKPVIY